MCRTLAQRPSTTPSSLLTVLETRLRMEAVFKSRPQLESYISSRGLAPLFGLQLDPDIDLILTSLRNACRSRATLETVCATCTSTCTCVWRWVDAEMARNGRPQRGAEALARLVESRSELGEALDNLNAILSDIHADRRSSSLTPPGQGTTSTHPSAPVAGAAHDDDDDEHRGESDMIFAAKRLMWLVGHPLEAARVLSCSTAWHWLAQQVAGAGREAVDAAVVHKIFATVAEGRHRSGIVSEDDITLMQDAFNMYTQYMTKQQQAKVAMPTLPAQGERQIAAPTPEPAAGKPVARAGITTAAAAPAVKAKEALSPHEDSSRSSARSSTATTTSSAASTSSSLATAASSRSTAAAAAVKAGSAAPPVSCAAETAALVLHRDADPVDITDDASDRHAKAGTKRPRAEVSSALASNMSDVLQKRVTMLQSQLTAARAQVEFARSLVAVMAPHAHALCEGLSPGPLAEHAEALQGVIDQLEMSLD